MNNIFATHAQHLVLKFLLVLFHFSDFLFTYISNQACFYEDIMTTKARRKFQFHDRLPPIIKFSNR
jgi:hypothetical protein